MTEPKAPQELHCAYHPDGIDMCRQPTTTIAIGATENLGMYYIPVCSDCALKGDGWTLAYPYQQDVHEER